MLRPHLFLKEAELPSWAEIPRKRTFIFFNCKSKWYTDRKRLFSEITEPVVWTTVSVHVLCVWLRMCLVFAPSICWGCQEPAVISRERQEGDADANAWCCPRRWFPNQDVALLWPLGGRADLFYYRGVFYLYVPINHFHLNETCKPVMCRTHLIKSVCVFVFL